MDLLQSYDVSSEESDEEIVEMPNVPAEEEKRFDTKEARQNYFGIDFNDDRADDDDDDDDDDDRSKALGLENAEFEVPQSEFWSALSKEDLQTAKERSNRLSTSNFKVLKSSQKHQSSNQAQSFKRTHEKYCPEMLSKNAKKESDNQQAVSLNSACMIKKIFYVHHKVKPGIHSQHRSRPAESEESHLTAHGGVVNRVKWNILQYSHLFLSASMDSTIKVWNAWSNENSPVRELRHHGKAVKDAEWSADGRNILSCSYDRTAVLSDVETGKAVCKLVHSTYVTCGKFNPVRRSQVLTGSTNCVLHWDVRTPHTACREFQYKDDMGQVQDLLFSGDGNVLFTCTDMVTRDSADRNVMAWDYHSGVTLSNQIYQERYSCTRLKLHPSSGHFLAQSHGGYIALFSINRPFKMVRSKRFEGHKLLGYSIGFDISRDGSLVYSGSSDGKIHCYDYQTGKLKKSLVTDLGVCMDVACHPVLSSALVTCSWGGNVKVFH